MPPTHAPRRLPAAVAGGLIAAGVGLVPATAHAATDTAGRAGLDPTSGLVSVRGTDLDDVVVVRSVVVDGVASVAVDLDGDGAADSVFPEALVQRLRIAGRGGNDRLAVEGLPARISATLVGDEGDDVLQGADGVDTLLGGLGNDLVLGGRGDDIARLGAGDDRFGWAPGEGNDRVDGQAGSDTQIFLGAAIDESIRITAREGRVRFVRDVGAVVMDLDGIETLDTNLLGGARDSIEVGDLTGTDVTHVTNALGNNPGNQGIVVVHGTPRADAISTLASAGVDGVTANVLGGPATVTTTGMGAEDEIVVRAGAGDDQVTASIPAEAIRHTIDGESGDDFLSGSDADDVLVGGTGDDVVDGQLGDDIARLGSGELDLFIWDPGDGSDDVDGGAGTDVLVFRGSAGAERFALNTTGRNESRFTRDLGDITMDLRAVEVVDVTAMGGADELLVGDLTGSGLVQVVANLSVVPGTPGSDGAVDSVVVDGTARADRVAVSGAAPGPVGSGTVEVTGLPAGISLSRVEPTDRLTIRGLGGIDTLDRAALPDGVVELAFTQ